VSFGVARQPQPRAKAELAVREDFLGYTRAMRMTRVSNALRFINQDIHVNAGRPKVQLLLRLFRTAQLARMPYDRPSSLLAKAAGAGYLFFSDWLLGVDIPVKTTVGSGLRIEHTSGIVINGRAVIGSNVTLLHGVTIGVLDAQRPGTPVIEDSVELCANAVVAGAIVVGRGAFVGANAVVTKDVPERGVAVGNPAIVKRTRPESTLKPLTAV